MDSNYWQIWRSVDASSWPTPWPVATPRSKPVLRWAIAEAEHLTAAEAATSDVLYNGAAVYSLAGSVLKNEDPTKSEGYAAQALALLKRAVAKGFTDVTYLRKDRGFEPLRSHDGFQKLLAELTSQDR